MTPEERARIILDDCGPRLRDLLAQATRLLRIGKLTRAGRGNRIIEIAEAINGELKPRTACAKGCSHCCHMATAISGHEARIIGRYTGRAPANLGRANVIDDGVQDHLVESFTGVPCTFLDAAGRCSIYVVRPIACRLHHTLNDTEANCRIEPGVRPAPTVPELNLTPVIAASAFAFLSDDFGDIREFFPP